jgi:phospholipase C
VVNEFDGLGASSSGYEWTTYPERLQQAGVSWKVYQNMPDNFTDNPLAGFKQYRRANELSGQPVSHDDLISPAYDEKLIALNLYTKGLPIPCQMVVFRDIQARSCHREITAGQLVVAPATYSEHPGPSSPVQGAWYIQEVLNALTANPEIWSQTVLLINFDENDGFFDHVPSPSAPSKDDTGKIYGKTTLPAESLSPEYFSHPAVATAKSQPKPDGRVYGRDSCADVCDFTVESGWLGQFTGI